jgi:hypothetical protein
MMSACIIAAQAIMLPVGVPETAGPGRDRRSVLF